MTNREKLKEVFPYTIFIFRKEDDKTNAIMCTDEWLDSEYIEPTTKNNLSSGLEKTRKKLEKDFGELDCISRKRAIERLKLNFPISQGADNSRDRHRYMQALADLQAIKELPSVTPQEPKIFPIAEIKYDKDKLKELVNKAVLTVAPQEPEIFKWCDTCREYDQEKHCCHRWSKVIRDTVEEMKQEYIEREVLDKIRAEIVEMRSKQNVGVLECLDIIDKYRAENEPRESEDDNG